jgi:uncharacterized protein YbjT (DUF2867 family)
VLGGTGQTGQHFTRLALEAGHHVQVLERTPAKLTITDDDLEVVRGSIDEGLDFNAFLDGVDAVVMMLGDAAAQRERQVNTAFVRSLVPAMRRSGTRRLL